MSRLDKVVVPDRIDYPIIPPVPAGVNRPLFSVMIPTYNCAHLLEKTLTSVLADDLGPAVMEIEVIDDCSTKDDPEEVVRRVGKGRVKFYRQPRNIGIALNFTTCIQRAHGIYVQILNGDDMVLPGFYREYKKFIQEHPEVVMVHNRAVCIDEHDNWLTMYHGAPNQNYTGIVPNAQFEMVKDNFTITSTNMVRRDVYEKIGGFAPCLTHSADWEMWMRVAACGPVGYIHHPYFLYRVHSNSNTGTLMTASKNIEDALRALKIGVRRLPEDLRKEAEIGGLQACACIARNCGKSLHQRNNHRAALRNTLLALRLHPSLLNLVFVIRSTIYCLKLKALFS